MLVVVVVEVAVLVREVEGVEVVLGLSAVVVVVELWKETDKMDRLLLEEEGVGKLELVVVAVKLL